jgi:hypothetical protein
MHFHPTNSKDDPGVEVPLPEVVSRFWASDEGKAWAAAEQPERLDRCSSRWIMDELGGCDRETLDECLDAIYDGRPK